MNAIYEHPSLKMHVTPEQRDRAESWLKEAYADGRISELEFDQRIGQVLSAVSRKDLNEAFYGLVQVPTPSRALGVHRHTLRHRMSRVAELTGLDLESAQDRAALLLALLSRKI